MPQSQYRARQVGDKTREVIDYDHDESLPGKPLHILIPADVPGRVDPHRVDKSQRDGG